MYMMLMHESHVFELRVETTFEVCDPCGFLTLLNDSNEENVDGVGIPTSFQLAL